MTLLLVLLFFQVFLSGSSGQAPADLVQSAIPEVKISLQPFTVESVTHEDTIQWQVPTGLSPVYCVASMTALTLKFLCWDCDSAAVNASLTKNTQNLEQTAKFPVSSLSRIPVTKEMNGKTIFCQATYKINGTTEIVNSQPTKMNILYLERPIVVNEKNQTAMENTFYIDENGGTLTCLVDSNPPPTEYVWVYGSSIAGNGKTLSVDTSRLQQILRCNANNGLFQYNMESLAVRVDKWGSPKVETTNFKDVLNDSQVKIGETIQLECKVSGNPKPIVTWAQTTMAGRTNKNITLCSEGADTTQQELPPKTIGGFWEVFSKCSLNVRDYTFAGEYFCVACNSKALNDTSCQTEDTEKPLETATFDVVGPPKLSPIKSSASQVPYDTLVVLYAHYCADPEPKVPAEVHWVVDNQMIEIEKEVDNYLADKPTVNSTFTDCYTARLIIDPITETDKEKDYTLKIQNAYGSLDVDVPVKQLLSLESDGDASSGAGGLNFAAIILFFAIISTAALMEMI